MIVLKQFTIVAAAVAGLGFGYLPRAHSADEHEHAHHIEAIEFSIQSVDSGDWSNPKTWQPARLPKAGDRVLVSRNTQVRYDANSPDVIRMVQVVGTLEFARDRDTELNVGLIKVQNSSVCSESGFACDFRGVNRLGEPAENLFPIERPQLLVGTLEEPIPAEHTAKIRLHYLEGMSKDDAPALVCCSARMDIHGSPLNRTWVELGADVKAGDQTVTLDEEVTGWRVGDEVIVTGSLPSGSGTLRNDKDDVQTEERVITKIDGTTLTLNEPLKNVHFGSGDFRSEVANLSRNVVVESADPQGVRGHTLYHRYSTGGISYARFAHLGKENVLGRYAIHFHLIGDTMRGSQVQGAAIVDSHNRWVTVHGADYLVVRDCVGYKSVGHGFFLEDGTEAYNLLDRNLGVQAYSGKRLPKQVLPFDPNDGAAFWWTNGRNSLVRNVACENDEYGFRYDCQGSRYFDIRLPMRMPSGEIESVDIRSVPVYRFEANEAHTAGLYGIVFAGNELTERERIGPDREHPHILRNNTIWRVHYGLRPQIPRMLVENLNIEHADYGIYRPMFDDHVYRNLRISDTNTEPFNRALDDDSDQYGKFTVDGLTFVNFYEGDGMPLIQMSDNNVTGEAESHFRNLTVTHSREDRQRPWFNRGGGRQVNPTSERDVPYYLHDYFGPGRDAKIVNVKAKGATDDGNKYQDSRPVTGREAQLAEVGDVEFPELLDPVDDLPPATIITSVRRDGDALTVRGVSHDNGKIVRVTVNGKPATMTAVALDGGLVDWEATLPSATKSITAAAADRAGNQEQTPHEVPVERP